MPKFLYFKLGAYWKSVALNVCCKQYSAKVTFEVLEFQVDLFPTPPLSGCF